MRQPRIPWILTMRYPPSEPYAVHRIHVDEPHEIYVEECGNPKGVPVVFLHGGPGSGCSPEHRRFFDPAYYRVILFDQRGCGRSLPAGETERNRTSDLISDMEAIRSHLGIAQWLLFGGSWGATLALIYALHHPSRLLGMVLRGTFLAREADLAWFFQDLRHLLPQAWERFTQGFPVSDLSALLCEYHARVHGADKAMSLRAAQDWSEWGVRVLSWLREETPATERDHEHEHEHEESAQLLAKVRIETHYACHRYFIAENEMLQRIDTLPALPVSIVHGRWDLACTLEAAWLLHRAIPGSRLVVVQAGHLMSEPAMADALVEEMDRMRTLL
jgi:proline iminopeptidase